MTTLLYINNLQIGGRVPIGIVDDHSVGASQIDAEPADSCRQQKHKDFFVLLKKLSNRFFGPIKFVLFYSVKSLDELLADFYWRVSIHSQVIVPEIKGKLE